MIFATDRMASEKTLGVLNPNKEAIISLMDSVDVYGCAEGYLIDYATGEPVKPLPDDDYVLGDLCWSAGDRWNFEHNDLELNEEFCKRILEYA